MKESIIAVNNLILEENIEKAVELLTNLLKENDKNIELLALRAKCYTKLNKMPFAINDYNEILKITPDNKEILGAKLLAEYIVSTSSLDVYASTNTHLDPWD